MFSRVGSAAIKKDLTNTLLICQHLDNPQTKFKSIHVAGTNGKGSVSHMLAAIFQTAGYKTGLYTSPHLYDFRERIKLNGAMVTEDFVITFVERVKPLIESIEPSFFEITVAMAFEFFAEEKIDIAIIETGLGGRLDSTNIITPELAVITNIGYDHMNILGNSLKEIAAEKAGIIKQNVPVVIGEYLKETKPVFDEKAKEKNASVYYAQHYLTDILHSLTRDHLQIIYERMDRLAVKVKTDLQGIYQVDNVRTVLTALQMLNKNNWEISPNDISNGLKNVKALTGLHGRWEVIQTTPTVVLEVAHNENGIKQMLKHIDQLSYHNLHIILGMVKDKEINNILGLLPKNVGYYFTEAHIPRALDGQQLQTEAKRFGLEGKFFDDVNTALKDALSKASPDDLIIICGSIFLVAEVKR
jgi:dihydrofolate synthase/folylpolyglutamate synthase